MIKPKPALKKQNRQTLFLITGLILLCVATVGFGVYQIGFSFGLWGPNHAAEVANPLEQSLEKAGAIKISSSGDLGQGPDNLEPYYDSHYEVALPKNETIELIQKAAKENGYSLTHASVDNRGHMAVADMYLDSWYFDNTSKKNPYPSLKDGTIMLAIKIDDEDKEPRPGHTLVRISIKLPTRK